jgi:hypothetical protein
MKNYMKIFLTTAIIFFTNSCNTFLESGQESDWYIMYSFKNGKDSLAINTDSVFYKINVLSPYSNNIGHDTLRQTGTLVATLIVSKNEQSVSNQNSPLQVQLFRVSDTIFDTTLSWVDADFQRGPTYLGYENQNVSTKTFYINYPSKK